MARHGASYTRSHDDDDDDDEEEENSLVVVKQVLLVSRMRIAIVGSGVSGISALWVSYPGWLVGKADLSAAK
jgi:hypothetical protein